MGMGGGDTAWSREGGGLCRSMRQRATIVDEVFDIQLSDWTEEMLVIINHLDDELWSLLQEEEEEEDDDEEEEDDDDDDARWWDCGGLCKSRGRYEG